MADQARLKDKPSLRSRVVRAQKISQTGVSPDATSPPTTARDLGGGDVQDQTSASAPPTMRSHTPGHVTTKSQGRRKPSESAVRPRAQTSSSVQSSVVSPDSIGQAPPLLSPTSKPPVAPLASMIASAPTLRPHGPNRDENGGSGTSSRDAQDSSAGSGKEAPSNGSSGERRPSNSRTSSSAVASNQATKGTTAQSNSKRTTHTSGISAQAGGSSRRAHTAFPPLADPSLAPDVAPAPSSGMYWSRAQVSGAPHPSLRAHTTTLIGSNVYVFGGCDARACFRDLYVLDADAFYWSTPQVAGDVPVPLRAMTCTAVGKKLVVFGGGDGPSYYNDVSVLDTVNFRWSRPRVLGDRVPSKRRAHTACLYKNGLYVFGGGDGVRALNDIWRLDVADPAKMSWKLVSAPSAPDGNAAKENRPKARGYHTANMVGSKLIIFGGSDGGECFNDVWVYDVETHVWKAVSVPVTFRRLSHTATIVGSYLFVIGGHDGNEYSNDVLLLNLVTMAWDKRKVYGLPPSGRGYHGTVLYDSRLLMMGGFDGSEVFGDVWILELAVHAYYSQISHFTIEV